MPKTYAFYFDPGHEWLCVPRSELNNLDILNKISEYSYQSRDSSLVYLEGDSDAGIFVEAYKAAYGMEPVIVEADDKTERIRKLPRFNTRRF